MKREIETQNFSFRVPKQTLEKCRYMARYDCRSVASMIRVILEEQITVFERENGEIRL